MGNERAEELIRKYLEGTATPEEVALLESWYIATAKNQADMPGTPDYEKIRDEIVQPLRAEQLDQQKWAQRIPDQPKPDQPTIKSPVRLWPAIIAAASVLVILSVGSLFIFRKKPMQSLVESPQVETDILPAGSRATLTLLNDQNIALDSANSDSLVRQGNAIVGSHNGELTYTTNHPSAENAYNTLTTKPGEHYSVKLPDGTKVWLNAASSITYPVAFIGKERRVTVTGELYFEIVHNPKQPFRVAVKDELVEDLGTHLNINAYDDEPAINTTLLEGSIKVRKGNTSAVLKPGQQATMVPGASAFQIKKIDPDEALAWKNGYFYFDRADIKTVMRELARWYDVQVVYKGELPKRTFKGKVYRNIKASEALGILSYFGAHFRVEGKTVTVSP
jgi:transmembrane sensor